MSAALHTQDYTSFCTKWYMNIMTSEFPKSIHIRLITNREPYIMHYKGAIKQHRYKHCRDREWERVRHPLCAVIKRDCDTWNKTGVSLETQWTWWHGIHSFRGVHVLVRSTEAGCVNMMNVLCVCVSNVYIYSTFIKICGSVKWHFYSWCVWSCSMKCACVCVCPYSIWWWWMMVVPVTHFGLVCPPDKRQSQYTKLVCWGNEPLSRILQQTTCQDAILSTNPHLLS